MKKVNYTVVELEAMSAPALRELIGTKGISRTSKPELVKLATAMFDQPTVEEKKAPAKKTAPKAKKQEGSTEVKVNKSDLLRREIRKRARAG